MKKSNQLMGVAAAAALIWALPANAGSLEPTPAPHWTGFYLGVNVGGGSFDGDVTDLDEDLLADTEDGISVNLTGFGAVYGAQMGVNRQWGNGFFGLEADFSGTTFDEKVVLDRGDHRAEVAWDWFSTVRARVGVAIENAVFYATGGLAIVRADYCGASDECVTDGDDALAFTDTKLGFAAGAGTEILIDPNWSLKAEYLFIDAGEETRQYDDDNEDQKAQFESSAHIFRVGLNYHVRDVPPALEEVDSLK